MNKGIPLGISTIEIYTSSKVEMSRLRNEKTWGYPEYLLDPRIQDGKKVPKWETKTRMGQYLRKSPKYARSVGIIRNLRTGYISPQFHVIYVNRFHTMMGGKEYNEAVINYIWENLMNDLDAVEDVVDPVRETHHPILRLHPSWLLNEEQDLRNRKTMNNEVTRRIDVDQQDQSTPSQDENSAVAPTDPGAGDESEEDTPDVTLRRVLARAGRVSTDYSRMIRKRNLSGSQMVL